MLCECPGEYWHLKFSQGCQRPCTHPPSNTDLSKWRHHDQRARVHSPYGYDRPCACPHTCPCWTSKTVAVTAVRACAQGIGPGTCISLLLIYHSGVPSRFRSSGFGFVIHRSSWFALLTVLKVQPDTCFSFFSGFAARCQSWDGEFAAVSRKSFAASHSFPVCHSSSLWFQHVSGSLFSAPSSSFM